MDNTGERLLTDVYNEHTIEHLHRYAFALQFVENKQVVDIASGEGYGANLLSSRAHAVIGIDIDNETIEHAKIKYTKNNLSYIQGSAFNIPIESSTIDIVTSFETIEHHDKHEEMLREIKRILKPNGMLIISTPEKLYYSDALNYSNEFHVKELYFDEFKKLINSFFQNSVFLYQKIVYSSVIIQNEVSDFYEFSGDFNKIKKHKGIEKPIYNMAIASQEKITDVFSSSFNGEKFFDRILEGYYDSVINGREVNEVLESKSFRLGHFIIKILAKIKYIICLKFLY